MEKETFPEMITPASQKNFICDYVRAANKMV